MKIQRFNEKVSKNRFLDFIKETRQIKDDTAYYFNNIKTNLKTQDDKTSGNIHIIKDIFQGTGKYNNTIWIDVIMKNSINDEIWLIGEERKNYINFINNTDFYKNANKYNL